MIFYIQTIFKNTQEAICKILTKLKEKRLWHMKVEKADLEIQKGFKILFCQTTSKKIQKKTATVGN